MRLQETRIAKLLVQLKSRLQPFCVGEAEAFREVQCINAEQLAAASFGSVMLQVGRLLQRLKANITRCRTLQIGWFGLASDGQCNESGAPSRCF
jgi:hypothetical protein